MNITELQGQPLNLELCFNSGQAFGWESTGDWYEGVISCRFFRLRCEADKLLWEAFPDLPDNERIIAHYFRLDQDILSVYAALKAADPGLADITDRYYGLRLLRQPIEETFFSFMATACNNIPRITAGLKELRELCGMPICTHGHVVRRCFPDRIAITECTEEDMTSIKGLAFRGRNMLTLAHELPEDFFETLESCSYTEARKMLMEQKFIGPKLADCICLFGLDKEEAVPVDTHVYQIGVRHFGLSPAKTISKGVYDKTAAAFRERYGRLAGWGQQFLFMNEIA